MSKPSHYASYHQNYGIIIHTGSLGGIILASYTVNTATDAIKKTQQKRPGRQEQFWTGNVQEPSSAFVEEELFRHNVLSQHNVQKTFSASTMCRNPSQPAQCAGTLLSQHNVQEPFSASTMCRNPSQPAQCAGTLLSQHNVQEPFSASTMCRNPSQPAQCAGTLLSQHNVQEPFSASTICAGTLLSQHNVQEPFSASIMCRNPSSIICRNCFGIMCMFSIMLFWNSFGTM